MFNKFKKLVPEYVLGEKLELKPIASLDGREREGIYSNSTSMLAVASRDLYKAIVTDQNVISVIAKGQIKSEDLKNLAEKSRLKGWELLPIIKDVRRKNTILHFSKEHNLLFKKIDEFYGIRKEIEALKGTKALSRIDKLMSGGEKIPCHKVDIIPDLHEMEGIIFANPHWMETNNIVFAEKTGVVLKSLIVPMPAHLKTNADLIIPESENKLKLTAEKLKNLIFVRRDIRPATVFSRRPGEIRNPFFNFDLRSYSDISSFDMKKLDIIREYMETGVHNEEFLMKYFTYEYNGKVVLNKFGRALDTGHVSEDMRIEIDKILKSAVVKVLKGRLGAVYGRLVDFRVLDYIKVPYKKKTGWITFPPYTFPVFAEYAIHEHCIAVDRYLIKLFERDMDGDLVIVYHKNRLKGFPGTKTAADRLWLEDAFKVSEKVDSKHEISVDDAMSLYVDQLSKCGQLYNRAKIIVEGARMTGKTAEKDLWKADIRMMTGEVHDYINGFKYVGKTDLPTSSDLIKKYDLKVNSEHLKRAATAYKAVKGRGVRLSELINTAKKIVDPIGFYEKLLVRFKNWDIN